MSNNKHTIDLSEVSPMMRMRICNYVKTFLWNEIAELENTIRDMNMANVPKNNHTYQELRGWIEAGKKMADKVTSIIQDRKNS